MCIWSDWQRPCSFLHTKDQSIIAPPISGFNSFGSPHPPPPNFIFLMYLWSLIFKVGSSPVIFRDLPLAAPPLLDAQRHTMRQQSEYGVFVTPSLRRNVLGEEEGWKSLSPPTAPAPSLLGNVVHLQLTWNETEPGLWGQCLAAVALSRSLPCRAT